MKKLFLIPLLFMGILGNSQSKVMTPELMWSLGRVSLITVSPNQKEALYSVTHYDVDSEKGTTKFYSLNIKTKKAEELNIQGGSFTYNSKGMLTFIKNGKLYEYKKGGNTLINDFKDKSFSNILFSPKGDKILYTKKVKVGESVQDKYPNYKKANVKIYDDMMIRHWDHWQEPTEFTHIFVADYNNGVVSNEMDIMKNEKWSCPMKPFDGRGQITWNKEGDKIIYATKKKFGKDFAFSTNSDIYSYDINTKSTENLSEGIMGYDKSPKISNDGKYLAWLSMDEDGNEADKKDIVILDIKTKKRYNLTANWDETIEDFRWANNDKSIIFNTGIKATYQLFSLKWKKGFIVNPKKDIKQITKGWHNIGHFELVGKNAIATMQNMSSANEIYLYNLKNGKQEKVTFVNDKVYNSIDKIEITQRWVETSDKKKMLVWVLLPPNFDKNKKYPTLLYCQGGPQSAVSQFYSFRWNFQIMASKGYVIVAPNRRGLPSFGVKWNADISGDWGGQPIRDYLSAIDAVKKEPFIDENKLGAVGASYGGYSVNILAGVHEKRFKAFITHCGVISMKDMYGTTEELFFSHNENSGNYWDNPKLPAYNEFDPINHIQKWDTPLLVIHGGKDYRIPYTQGIHAFQAAKMKGVPAKLVYFPEENHWVLNPQNSLIWYNEFYSWLDKWLK